VALDAYRGENELVDGGPRSTHDGLAVAHQHVRAPCDTNTDAKEQNLAYAIRVQDAHQLIR
jgi:hypothetical protein